MKEETKRFFSPFATWTRIPGTSGIPGTNGDAAAATSSAHLMNSVGSAVDEYVRAYSNLLDTAELDSESTNTDAITGIAVRRNVGEIINEDYLEEYLAYRTLKDPAKKLLTGEGLIFT